MKPLAIFTYEIIHRFAVPNLYSAKCQPDASTIHLFRRLGESAPVRNRDAWWITGVDSTKAGCGRPRVEIRKTRLTKVTVTIGIFVARAEADFNKLLRVGR